MSSTTITTGNYDENSYPVFEANQVLSSEHLNGLTYYLDHQNRATRVKLIGVGITCGLTIDWDASTNILTINGGTGITSEGHLIQIETTSYSMASEPVYADPANYHLFSDASDSVTSQIDMWELIEEVPSSGTFVDFTTVDNGLSSGPYFMDNKVVLLFLEIADNDLKSCLGENCDDKGIERIFTVRKLLVRCEDAAAIIREGYTIPNNVLIDSELNKRFIPDYQELKSHLLIPEGTAAGDFDAKLEELNSSAKLLERFTDLFGTTGEVNNTLLLTISEKIADAYQTYLPILEKAYDADPTPTLLTDFNAQRDAHIGIGTLQYYYDYIKDVYKGYNEFVHEAFELTSECCPDTARFPQHLMLGKVLPAIPCAQSDNEVACKPAIYRTHFIQTPIYNQQLKQVEKVQTLFARLIGMISNFRSSLSLNDTIGVTPSEEKLAELGKSAIPYYYNVNTGNQPLYKLWDFEKKRRCKSSWNKSYHANNYDEHIPAVQNPLSYNKDNSNFYRIEGALDQSYTVVEAKLHEIKKEFNLDFDVVSLQLRNMETKATDCGVVDLKEEYLQLRNELIGLTRKYDNLIILGAAIAADPSVIGKLPDTPPEQWAETILGVNPVTNLIDALDLCLDEFDIEEFRIAYKKLIRAVYVVAAGVEYLIRMSGVYGIYVQYLLERLLNHNGFIGDIYDATHILRSSIDVQMRSVKYSYIHRSNTNITDGLFSEFVKHNQGVEHMAGVPKGGTFIMVYGDEDNKRVVADFAINGKDCCCIPAFPFCEEEPPKYGPIARTVYKYITRNPKYVSLKEVPPTPVIIDVLSKCVDLNVEELDLEPFSNEENDEQYAYTKKGGKVRKITVPILGQVVQYIPPSVKSLGLDEFDYTIYNRETEKEDTNCVLVCILPISSKNIPQFGGKPDFKFPPKEGITPPTEPTTPEVPTPTTDPDPGIPTWEGPTGITITVPGTPGGSIPNEGFRPVRGDGDQPDITWIERIKGENPIWNDRFSKLEVYKIFESEEKEDDEVLVARERIKNIYIKLGEGVPKLNNADATKKYETQLIQLIGSELKEIRESIVEVYDEIGNDKPTNALEQIEFMLNSTPEDYARLTAYKGLYKELSETMIDIIGEHDLGIDNGPVRTFFGKQMKSHLKMFKTRGIDQPIKLAYKSALERNPNSKINDLLTFD